MTSSTQQDPTRSDRKRRARKRMVARRRRAAVAVGCVVVVVGAVLAVIELTAAPDTSSPTVAKPAPTTTSPTTASPAPGPLTARKPSVTSASGVLAVVPGSGPRRGSGPVSRYTVDVEKGLPESAGTFAAAVDTVLRDPRSWGHGGARSFQRVSSGPTRFQVVLASPRTTDKLCGKAGLDTEGKVSCFNGDRAIINQNRWESAVPWFNGNIARYRAYVLNHEIGHALGHHHEQCAGRGKVAPVMQEQTYGMQGCTTNGWPFPTGKGGQ